MIKKTQTWTSFLAIIGFLILVLDAKTALTSTQEGIKLCITTVIPALFPFFILSAIINASLMGKHFKLIQPLCKMCSIPDGAESLLLLGFLGGYPIGAQCINEAFAQGVLKKEDAQRMLGFCNNAGPAFIFGMVGSLFSQPYIPWLLWIIHIVCGLIVGCIIPKNNCRPLAINLKRTKAKSNIMKDTISSMVLVCGWVILFRIIISFCNLWFLWIFPEFLQVFFSGIIELSNGCYALQQISSPEIRFVLCAGMLGFGGLCVAMQTVSITSRLGTGMYFPGKLLHGSLSMLVAILIQQYLFEGNNTPDLKFAPLLLCSLIMITMFSLYCKKKIVAIPC